MARSPTWIANEIERLGDEIKFIDLGVRFFRQEGDQPERDITKETRDRAQVAIEQLTNLKQSYEKRR
jgi:hypothetical protein